MALSRTLDDGFQAIDFVTDDVIYRSTSLTIAVAGLAVAAVGLFQPKPVYGECYITTSGSDVTAPTKASMDGENIIILAESAPTVTLNGVEIDVTPGEVDGTFVVKPKSSRSDGVMVITAAA